mgnify:CR=1 FL=1
METVYFKWEGYKAKSPYRTTLKEVLLEPYLQEVRVTDCERKVVVTVKLNGHSSTILKHSFNAPA